MKNFITRRKWLGALGSSAALAAAMPTHGQTPPGRVRITGFRIHKVTVRWRDLVFLQVETDAGLTGLGEATLEGRAEQAEAALRWLEPAMVGQDPSGMEAHWNRNYYLLSRWRNGPEVMTAISAVDIALWDIEAQRLGVPLARLLGGPLKDRYRVYYTHWAAPIETGPRTAQKFADRARESVDKGWTAVKWTISGAGSESERVAQTVTEVRAVREAAGAKLDLALEAAETLTVRSATALAEAVAPWKPLWIEEPTLRESPRGLGQVAQRSPVPIASGEGLFTRYEFLELFEQKGAAIAQPDVLHAGGITEMRKIAALAEVFGVELAPHQCSGPVGHVASLAAMCTCRNFLIQEWEAADDALFSEVSEGTYPVQQQGTVGLPKTAGLGIRLNFPEFLKRCPYQGVRRKALMSQ